jgi:hypothetical protein
MTGSFIDERFELFFFVGLILVDDLTIFEARESRQIVYCGEFA